jgi:hypothetical protein
MKTLVLKEEQDLYYSELLGFIGACIYFILSITFSILIIIPIPIYISFMTVPLRLFLVIYNIFLHSLFFPARQQMLDSIDEVKEESPLLSIFQRNLIRFWNPNS